MDFLINPYRIVYPIPGDPFWAQSIALLHFDGDTTNSVVGGIAFTLPTGSTGTSVPTGTPRFGTGSLQVNGNSPGGGGTQGALGTLPTSANGWGLTEGDFTVEMWVYLNNTPATPYAPLLWTFDDISRTEVNFRMDPDSGGVYKLTCLVRTADAGQSLLGGTVEQTPVPIGQWFHAAVSRQSGVYRIFQDGAMLAFTAPITYSAPETAKGVRIGTVNGFALDGLIDDVRVTKAARYTAAFTAPTAPFPDYPL